MSNIFDSALILELTNTKKPQTYSASNTGIIIRPLAPFALNELFVKRDIPSTVINYVEFWDNDTLLEHIVAWCTKHAVRRPLVLCSTLFNTDLLNSSTVAYKVIKELKQKYDITLIIGGPDNEFLFEELVPDLMFMGRSIHLFEHWIDGLPISNDCLTYQYNGVSIYRPKNEADLVEMPIVSKLFDDYCLQPTDVVTFETRLGCKFNCSFCSFEFRNAKKTHDAGADALFNFFKTAKEEYGVTHFNCADDTLNEDDTKLHYLVEAVEQLDYQPKITAFIRFDVLVAKKLQMTLLDKGGVHYQFWGTETFHPEASKAIKKKMTREKGFDNMHYIKETYPHWHRYATHIMGLPKEPIEYAIESINYIHDNDLADLSIIPLQLGNVGYGRIEHASDFVKYPEKFGINVREERVLDDNVTTIFNFSHEECDYDTAQLVAKRMYSKGVKKKGLPKDPWEKMCEDSLGNVTPELHIQSYIDLKKVQMLKVV
jgi:hypothetical protein